MGGVSSFLLLANMVYRASSFMSGKLHRVDQMKLRSSLSGSSLHVGLGSIDSFNPIGPPAVLSSLGVGETFLMPANTITRLSQSPDLFLIKNFGSLDNNKVLIHAASTQGMKSAGTRNSEANTIRKNSYLTWIEPYGIASSTSPEALNISRGLVIRSGDTFAHESMHKLIQEGGRVDYFFAEDLQIAKYDVGGGYDFHHDGYSRYLTVLMYLNGIGGTYFPFANLEPGIHEIDSADETSAVNIARRKLVGKEGLLLVGDEGMGSYLSSPHDIDENSIVEIEAGDAVAFYSYKPNGEKDWRALHCSLPVPKEKWISTCWFRSEALTGAFSYLKKEAMLEHSGE
jgi:hypothetical protein